MMAPNKKQFIQVHMYAYIHVHIPTCTHTYMYMAPGVPVMSGLGGVACF